VTRRLSFLFLVPLFAAAVAQVQPAPAVALMPASSSLPEGEGRTTFLRVCSDCHAAEIVMHQRLDAQGWKDIVYMMADQGAVASDAELETIVDYLSQSFPEEENPST